MSKLKKKIAFDPLLLEIYFTDVLSQMCKEICIEMFTAALFIALWKQLNVSQQVLREINHRKCVAWNTMQPLQRTTWI